MRRPLTENAHGGFVPAARFIRCFAMCLAAGFVAALAACASGGAASSASASASGSGRASGSSNTSSSPARHDRSVITEDDLKSANASNLYEAVQHLHPEWLIARNGGSVGNSRSASSSSSSNDVQVYLDNQRAGATDILKQMAITRATTLKYFSATEAQARFGNGNLNGVIQVVTSPSR